MLSYVYTHSANVEFLMLRLGRSAIEVLSYLIDRHSDITLFKCIDYPRKKSFNEWRKEETNRPPEDTTARCRQHDTGDRNWHPLPRTAATPDELLKIADSLPAGRALAITSKVTLADKRKLHIPLIDFQCNTSTENLQNVKRCMRGMDDAGGVILKSARSYHYYGMSLLTDDQWLDFVGRCLLREPDINMQPYVDIRYLGHRLQEGWGSLRISRDSLSGKFRNYPKVVDNVQPK